MKKWFIVLALALTGTVSGFAQQMSVGGRAGMQMTDYTKNGDGKAALKAFFGGRFTYRFSSMWAARAEGLLSLQGVNSEMGRFKERTIYLNLPILAVFQPIEKVSVEAGFTPGQTLRQGRRRISFD